MTIQLWMAIFLTLFFTFPSPLIAFSRDETETRAVNYTVGASKSCDPKFSDRLPHPSEPSAFFECLHDGRLEKFLCPQFYRQRKIFDTNENSCIAPMETKNRQKRQLPSSAGSQTVGQFCSFNTDCVSGGYCNNGRCECWSTHTVINNFCFRKINPDESGCQYDSQCDAVWPGASCNSAGICRCPFARPPATTRDGPVCYVPGECPTNSQYPKLRDPGTEVISTCQTTTVPPYFLIGCSIWFDVYDCYQNEYCCPSRALTCIQPLDEGTTSPGTSTTTRYYYNSVSQSCLSFTFLGAEGNSNNFLTIDQCESYCKNQCERGAPEYDTTTLNVGASGSRIRYCSNNGGFTQSNCGANFQCDSVESLQICCPRPTFVCGVFGGVQRTTTPSQPYSSGTTRGSGSPTTRWYWDQSLGRCTTFAYGGYGGNFNNFLSQSDCDSYCSQSLCTQGEPLKDNSGLTNFGCSSSSGCPTTHECVNSVCCPTVQTVCNQPQTSGAPCNSPTIRFWFNAQTGVCEQFSYNGCQGNANNFDDATTCNNYCAQIAAEPQCVQGKALKDGNNNFIQCAASTGLVGNTGAIQNCPSGYECYYDGNLYGCCPTQTFTCQRPSDSGTICNPTSSTRWYYDVTTLSCRSFQYFGCDGNSNNFAVQRDCEDYCGASGCPDGGEPYREVGGRERICSSSTACPTTHTCQSVSIQQAGQTLVTTTSYCCPRKSTICGLIQDQGQNCGNTLTRYFYNSQTRACEVFTYFGCGGNANNFPTALTCQNYCNSAACDTGELAYLDPVSSNIQVCSIAVINSCPSGYRCTFDPLGGQNVCCGSGDLGLCPNGQRSFIEGLTGSARQCVPNVAGNCPGNYLCVYNPTRRLYYCCGSRASTVCPNTAQAFIDPNTQQPRACTLNAINVCPGGFSCQSTIQSGSLYGYCCSGSVGNTVCGTGGVQTVNNQPVRCDINFVSQCNPPYSCRLSSTGDGVYYCCSDTATNVCPNDGGTYLVNGQPQQCSGSSTIRECPASFACIQSVNGNGLSYCCSSSQFSAYCGDATPFLIGGTTPQQCFPNTGSSVCPANYVCELSTTLNTYYCCTGSGCPSGYEAYLIGGSPQYCTGFGSTCLSGYQCLIGTTNGRSQCCRLRQTSAGCSNGAQAYINPSTGQPQLCTVNSVNTCVPGYSCQLGTSNQFVCCQGGTNNNNLGTCPNGQQTYISPSTGFSQSCVLNQINGCPVGYTCQQGTLGRALCCQSPNLNVGSCISGQTYISSTTGRAQTCQVGINTCPGGYSCQQGTSGQFLCCENAAQNNLLCPNGVSTPYVAPGTNQVTRCSGNSVTSGCPGGYICVQASGVNNQFICCPGTQIACPSGSTAYINPTTRLAQTCTTGFGTFNSCPAGYSCTQTSSISGTQSICCTGQAQPANFCPAGTTAYVNAGTRQPQACNPNGFNSFTGCVPGYSCQQGSNGGYYCCSGGTSGGGSTNSGCPAGAISFNQPGTNSPLACRFNGQTGDACPTGYSCRYSTVYFTYICCSSFNRGFSEARTKKNGTEDSRSMSVLMAADSPEKDCDENHILSDNNKICLQRMIPGERNCTETVQCKDFGVCESQRCKCNNDRIVHGVACVTQCPDTHENVDGFCEEKEDTTTKDSS